MIYRGNRTICHSQGPEARVDEPRLDPKLCDPGACAVDCDLVHPPTHPRSSPLGAGGSSPI